MIPKIELPSRPSITFTGRIYPHFIKIGFDSNLTVELPIPPGSPYAGLDAKMQLAIKQSEVEVRCYLNRIVQSDASHVFFTAYEFARAVVDLISFSKGM